MSLGILSGVCARQQGESRNMQSSNLNTWGQSAAQEQSFSSVNLTKDDKLRKESESLSAEDVASPCSWQLLIQRATSTACSVLSGLLQPE